MRTTSKNRVRSIVVAVAVVAAVLSLLLFSNLGRTILLKSYFRLESTWREHWPAERGKYALHRLRPLFNKLGPVRVEVEPGAVFYLDPQDWLPHQILTTGAWQPDVWNFLAPTLPKGGVFLDVGAHIGYFSLKAALKVGDSGRVVAFEPNPAMIRLLRQNLAASKIGNVNVQEIACTDREQMITLYASSTISTAVSSLAQENVKSETSPHAVTVRGRPIDEVVRELGLTRMDAIKIDVEGAEVSVLRGARETLKRFAPKVILEVAPDLLAGFHNKPEDVFALLREAGYTQGRMLSPGSDDWVWTKP
jgi:FkbM family methyltransferase